MRLLIVDDHAVVRRGIAQILSDALPDANFGEAGDAATALESIARERWDAALIDLNLPGRDGLALLEDIRRDHPSVAVLVVTAHREEEFAVRCLRLGARGFLTKDGAPDELVAAVRKVLAGGLYITTELAERLAAVVGGHPSAPHESLSTRELQVLRLVARGRSLRQIAGELNLSEKTVATYRARIAGKLHVSTNVELARYALKHRLVD
jgi:DNA-binding NarL/FixJ family response regulator